VFLPWSCRRRSSTLPAVGFSVADAAGWTVWSDRADHAAPPGWKAWSQTGEPGSLTVSGNGNIGEFGGWQRVVPGIEPGAWYRLTVHYRATGVTSENWQIQPRLDWRKTRAGVR